MKIEEKAANDTITINFIVHRAIVYSNIIHCTGKTPDEIFNEKLLIIKKISDEKGVYLEFAGKQKEIIKEWAKIDKQFKDLYKKLYPVGGWRNGGRPKGSKTNKTTMLKVRITPEEEQFLLEQLKKYRAKHQ